MNLRDILHAGSHELNRYRELSARSQTDAARWRAENEREGLLLKVGRLLPALDPEELECLALAVRGMVGATRMRHGDDDAANAALLRAESAAEDLIEWAHDAAEAWREAEAEPPYLGPGEHAVREMAL